MGNLIFYQYYIFYSHILWYIIVVVCNLKSFLLDHINQRTLFPTLIIYQINLEKILYSLQYFTNEFVIKNFCKITPECINSIIILFYSYILIPPTNWRQSFEEFMNVTPIAD